MWAEADDGYYSSVQIVAIKAILWLLSYFIDFEGATWDDKLVGGLDFFANSVLQVPFFLMSLMRYITPTLDQMFAFPILACILMCSHPAGLWILCNGWIKRIYKSTSRRIQRLYELCTTQIYGCIRRMAIQASVENPWMRP